AADSRRTTGSGEPGGEAAGAPSADVQRVAAAARVAVPARLVGSWSGDDAQRQGSWTITFTAAGRYRMVNERRGVRIAGTFTVRGARLTFRPSGGRPYTVSWSVSRGRLTLGGSVYLRLDASRSALVGDWISLDNFYKTLTFTAAGRFRVTDPTSSDVTGTYRVSGSQVTLSAPGVAPMTYRWSISGTILRLQRPDGGVAEYTRS
ncbi:MAG TPA: hypothetical protein VFO77_04290, partial [Actinoplanes sp.]|nr:hypothetical protein [Actinoplanes sp.]